MRDGPASRLQLRLDIGSAPPFRVPSDTSSTTTVVHDRDVVFTRQPSLKRLVDGLIAGGHDEELLDHLYPPTSPPGGFGPIGEPPAPSTPPGPTITVPPTSP